MIYMVACHPASVEFWVRTTVSSWMRLDQMDMIAWWIWMTCYHDDMDWDENSSLCWLCQSPSLSGLFDMWCRLDRRSHWHIRHLLNTEAVNGGNWTAKNWRHSLGACTVLECVRRMPIISGQMEYVTHHCCRWLQVTCNCSILLWYLPTMIRVLVPIPTCLPSCLPSTGNLHEMPGYHLPAHHAEVATLMAFEIR